MPLVIRGPNQGNVLELLVHGPEIIEKILKAQSFFPTKANKMVAQTSLGQAQGLLGYRMMLGTQNRRRGLDALLSPQVQTKQRPSMREEKLPPRYVHERSIGRLGIELSLKTKAIEDRVKRKKKKLDTSADREEFQFHLKLQPVNEGRVFREDTTYTDKEKGESKHHDMEDKSDCISVHIDTPPTIQDLRVVMEDVRSQHNNLQSREPHDKSGSTLVCAMATQDQVLIANVGDSSVFLLEQVSGGSWCCTRINTLHDLKNQKEQRRIPKNLQYRNGYVHLPSGRRQNVTRSFEPSICREVISDKPDYYPIPELSGDEIFLLTSEFIDGSSWSTAEVEKIIANHANKYLPSSRSNFVQDIAKFTNHLGSNVRHQWKTHANHIDDATIVALLPSQIQPGECVVALVCDGHGGSKTAERLVRYMRDIVKKRLQPKPLVAPESKLPLQPELVQRHICTDDGDAKDNDVTLEKEKHDSADSVNVLKGYGSSRNLSEGDASTSALSGVQTALTLDQSTLSMPDSCLDKNLEIKSTLENAQVVAAADERRQARRDSLSAGGGDDTDASEEEETQENYVYGNGDRQAVSGASSTTTPSQFFSEDRHDMLQRQPATTFLGPLEEEFKIKSFEEDKENTMIGIIFYTAKESECNLRRECDFARSTCGEKEEATLIEELEAAIKNRCTEVSRFTEATTGFYSDYNTALRALHDDNYSVGTDDDEDMDDKGVNLRNMVALYWKRIRKGKFCADTTTQKGAIDALCRGIANGQRGGNRNDQVEGDDKSSEDKPVCLTGRYNALACACVGIFPEVQIVYNILDPILELLRNDLIRAFVENCDGNWQIFNDFIQLQNTDVESVGSETRRIYNKLIERIKNNSDSLVNRLLKEDFPHLQNDASLCTYLQEKVVQQLPNLEDLTVNIDVCQQKYQAYCGQPVGSNSTTTSYQHSDRGESFEEKAQQKFRDSPANNVSCSQGGDGNDIRGGSWGDGKESKAEDKNSNNNAKWWGLAGGGGLGGLSGGGTVALLAYKSMISFVFMMLPVPIPVVIVAAALVVAIIFGGIGYYVGKHRSSSSQESHVSQRISEGHRSCSIFSSASTASHSETRSNNGSIPDDDASVVMNNGN